MWVPHREQASAVRGRGALPGESLEHQRKLPLLLQSYLSPKDVLLESGVDFADMNGAHVLNGVGEGEGVEPRTVDEQRAMRWLARIELPTDLLEVGHDLEQVPVLLVDPVVELPVLEQRVELLVQLRQLLHISGHVVPVEEQGERTVDQIELSRMALLKPRQVGRLQHRDP